MSIESIKYIGEGGVLAKGKGVLTGSDLIKLNDIIYESPEKIKKIAYQICDLSNVSSTSISTLELEHVASQDKKASESNPNMLIAIVGEDDLTYGLARMWEAYSYNSPFETMVFREIEDAHQWISEKLQGKT